jgi:hypothetical protein
MIMRASLHECAPNTHYGQWLRKRTRIYGLDSRAIAHNEHAGSAVDRAVRADRRDSLGNRIKRRRRFSFPERKN